MKKSFKEWLDLVVKIQDKLPDVSLLKCPKCSQKAVDFVYVGDVNTRVGYMDIWCNSCNHGIHMSRVIVPQNAPIIPFETPIDEFPKQVPNFKQVTP